MNYTDENVLKAIEGGYDVHNHTDPDYYPNRPYDDFELLKDLERFHMVGAVLKSHQSQSGTRAYLANKYAGTKAKAYGSIVFNSYVGGLNPLAFEAAIRLGIKVAWMPTKSAANEQKYLSAERRMWPSIYLLDDMGQLKQEVYEILDMAKKNDITIETGHVSAKEAIVVCEEAIKMGVRCVMTHPAYCNVMVPVEEQIRLGKMGAKIEFAFSLTQEFYDTNPAGANVSVTRKDLTIAKASVEDYANTIRKIGVENCIMVSDAFFAGYAGSPECIYLFARDLINRGFTEKEIQIMIKDNAKYILHEDGEN